jgi:hypothetical protein
MQQVAMFQEIIGIIHPNNPAINQPGKSCRDRPQAVERFLPKPKVMRSF